MDPILQTLGQSLGHWQAVYIVSIVIALLSTFAIVIFDFHIQEHKFGLKVSNYIHVAATLLTVLATIVIVNKTRSIDAEKDREVKVSTDAANIKIAQAERDADQASSKAAENRKANLQLQIELLKHEDKEHQIEKDFSERERMLAERSPVTLSEDGIKNLREYLTLYVNKYAPHEDLKSNIEIEFNYNDGDSLNFARSLMRAIPAPLQATPPHRPGTKHQGVTIVVKSLKEIPPLAQALFDGLKAMGVDVHPIIKGDVRPFRFLVLVGQG